MNNKPLWRLQKKEFILLTLLGSLFLIMFCVFLFQNLIKADTPTQFSINLSGSNGVISKSPDKATYAIGEKVLLQATPDSGYKFSRWQNGYRSNANPVLITIGKNTELPTDGIISIEAQFAQGSPVGANFKLEQVSSIPSDPGKQVFAPATGAVPTWREPFIQSETGYNITRITDFHNDYPSTPTDAYSGYTNGYSTYTYENVTGEYVMIENTASSCGPISLFRTSDHSKVKDLLTADSVSPICEPNDARWDLSGKPGTENTIYYQISTGRGKIYKQDVVSGQNELIYDFATLGISSEYVGTVGDDHMSQARDGTYRAIRFHNSNSSKWLIGVIDLQSKSVLPGMVEVVDFTNDGRYIPPNYAYTDISPDGTWLNVGGMSDPLYNSCSPEANPLPPAPLRFYRISDLANNNIDQYIELNTKRYGHSSWSYDKDQNEVFVSQNDCTDSYMAFNPVSQTQIAPIRMPELNGYSCLGVHVQRNDNPLNGGWLLMSTYGGNDIAQSNWAYNQIFMVEMKPEAEHPKIWRIAANLSQPWPQCSDYGSGKYFAQAFANINFAGDKIYWASNWGGTDNLETYKVDLPTNWHQSLSGEGTITISMPQSQHAYINTSRQLTATVSNADQLMWSKVSGEGTVTFSAATSSTTNISVDTPGTYIISLTASNTSGDSATRTITITIHKTGDINGDGKVDFLNDFTTLLYNWGTPKDPMADLNGDGVVDFQNDFTLLLYSWG